MPIYHLYNGLGWGESGKGHGGCFPKGTLPHYKTAHVMTENHPFEGVTHLGHSGVVRKSNQYSLSLPTYYPCTRFGGRNIFLPR